MRIALLLAALVSGLALGCSDSLGNAREASPPRPKPMDPLPEPVDRPVSFAEDVKPILDNYCVRCHSGEKDKGKFQYDTREAMMAGGKSGPAAIDGSSANSRIVKMVAHLKGVKPMPQGATRQLTRDEVAILRAWIDQGVAYE